jgi:hypothetical protein
VVGKELQVKRVSSDWLEAVEMMEDSCMFGEAPRMGNWATDKLQMEEISSSRSHSHFLYPKKWLR